MWGEGGKERLGLGMYERKGEWSNERRERERGLERVGEENWVFE